MKFAIFLFLIIVIWNDEKKIVLENKAETRGNVTVNYKESRVGNHVLAITRSTFCPVKN